MKPIVVIDLDGCTSNDHWRRHLLPAPYAEGAAFPHEAFAAYHKGIPHDEPINTALLHAHAHCQVLFITARPSSEREATIHWLKMHINPILGAYWDLVMRPMNNHKPSPALKIELLNEALVTLERDILDVICAIDDREDVLLAYRSIGIATTIKADLSGWRHWLPGPGESLADFVDAPVAVEVKLRIAEYPPIAPTARILGEMAKTYQERNEVYGDNFKQVGDAMAAMFPNGVTLKTPDDFNRWHLFELAMVKFTRFANSGLTHKDSIHDAAVYCAMVESLTDDRKVGSEK